jgi:low affinity Fe/Cu permease
VRLIRRIAARMPQVVGSPIAFLVALGLAAGWLCSGFLLHWSNTWLLWPSAIASVVTFLIAFSLQYTVNRDTRAIQLKLDEILRASERARDELIKVETLEDEDLAQVEEEIIDLRDAGRRRSK